MGRAVWARGWFDAEKRPSNPWPQIILDRRIAQSGKPLYPGRKTLYANSQNTWIVSLRSGTRPTQKGWWVSHFEDLKQDSAESEATEIHRLVFVMTQDC